MARALIVGCGCRGRMLGGRLRGAGWRVRGTSRGAEAGSAMLAIGIEPAIADPDRPGSILDHVGDVTLVFWLLGSARGETELLAAIHGPRLERVLERVVDTPLRGFVYERAGSVPDRHLGRGAEIVRAAADRWRIPVEVAAADPGDAGAWADAMLAAARRLTGGG